MLLDFDPDVMDASSDVPISQALKILKGNTLTNVAATIPQVSERYSYWYDLPYEKLSCEGMTEMVTAKLIMVNSI